MNQRFCASVPFRLVWLLSWCGCLCPATASVVTNANQDLVFGGLTAATAYAVPAGETATFRRIVTSGEKTVTFSGGADSRLALFGGGSVAPLQNDATDYSVTALDFKVPVDLTAADAAGGVKTLYVGGVTFRQPVTMTNSTQALAFRRKKGTGLKFTSASCRADFSGAERVEIGYPGQEYTGLNLAVSTSAQLTLPSTVLSMGSQLSADNSGAIVIDGDLTAPDPTYLQNGKTVYSVLKQTKGATITCRRLVESPTDGLRVFVDGGTFRATDGIEIHSLSDTPFKVGTATVRTPDFNTCGSQYVAVTNVLTLDTQDGVTRVGKLKVKAGKKVSAKGGGAVTFQEPVTLPVLELQTADDMLLFDRVKADRFALNVQSLSLPAGTAKLKVVNRMVSGTVTLATGGVTQSQFDALVTDIPTGSALTWNDGAIVFSVTQDLSLPVRAVWTADGWTCYNAADEALADTEPNEATTNIAFAADADLRAFEVSQFGEGTVLDLRGHAVSLAFDRSLASSFTVTDTSAGAPGAFHLFVPADVEFVNDKMTLAGNLRLVKEGEGTYVSVRKGDTFTGGEEIVAGRIVHLTEVVRYEEFGAVGDGVTDDKAALLAAHRKANEYRLPVRAKDGATYYLGGERTVIPIMTDVDFGTARLVIDDSQNVADVENDVFRVTRSAAAIDVSGVGPLARGQANLGVTLPATCLVQVVNANKKQFIRKGANANAGSSQHEVIVVGSGGDIDPSAPLVWDYEAVTSATAYPIDTEPLTVKGGVFVTIANPGPGRSGVYYYRGLSVSRSNVLVTGLRHEIEGEGADGNPYNGFLAVHSATDVRVEDCVFSGHRVYTLGGTSRGSYDISVNNSVGVTFRRCTQVTDLMDSSRWGVFVSNYSKNLTYEDCALSRFDAHCGVCNATIRRSTLGYQGINAIGFGRLLIEDSTVCGAALVNLRSDYGSLWRGDCIIRNCTFRPRSNSAVACLVSAENDGKHDFGYDCEMPGRITIDGLTVDDASVTAADGPYVFDDPNAKNTSAAYVETYPYAVTRRLDLKDVTVASGRTLKTAMNTWMFRDLAVTDRTVDVAFSVGTPAMGWNWTNATVSVDVTAFDPSVVTDGRLVLTVRDAAGAVVCERTKDVSAVGTVSFDIDVPAAGTTYAYSVRALDGDREILLATPATRADLFAGRIGTGEANFAAAVADGEPVVSGGTWAEAPAVDAEEQAYVVAGRAAFAIAEPNETVRTVRVEMTYPVASLHDPDAVDPVAGRLAVIAARDGGAPVWMAAMPTDAGIVWQALVGAAPAVGETAVVCVEVDRGFTPPRARYSVKVGDAFVSLTNAAGEIWVETPLAADWTPARVAFEGDGVLTGFEGWNGSAALAAVGDALFDDFNTALQAAAAAGQPLTLLVDVMFAPEGTSDTVTISVNGRRMKWSDGSGFQLVRDPTTGMYRLAEVPPGGNPNGLTSYESAALGLDPDDPDSKPFANFVRGDDGVFVLTLMPTPPTGTGAQVTCQLVESTSVGFEEPVVHAETSDTTFRIEPDESAAKFYRLKIHVK